MIAICFFSFHRSLCIFSSLALPRPFQFRSFTKTTLAHLPRSRLKCMSIRAFQPKSTTSRRGRRGDGFFARMDDRARGALRCMFRKSACCWKVRCSHLFVFLLVDRSHSIKICEVEGGERMMRLGEQDRSRISSEERNFIRGL